MAEKTEMIGFGGGCHWCTEAVFQTLRGVISVTQGFARSVPPDENWSEAVMVSFDPSKIDLGILIEIHLRTHASMSDHKMRKKYRSAVYTLNDAQGALAEDILNSLQDAFEKPLVTQTLPLRGFRRSEERFQNYYGTDRDRPFCRTHIHPKLSFLRDRYLGQMVS